MAGTHLWALVALVHIYCCVHSHSQSDTKLDELFLEPLRPLWYDGQPYAACETIIDTMYGTDTFGLNRVSV